MSPVARVASILAIGDEVLRGEVVNGNAALLADRLFDLGFALGEHRVVADDPAAMRAAIDALAAASDVVLVTGGLGPTDDDRTVDVVAAMLAVAPTIHAPSREVLERHFAARNIELTPNNLRQVRIPAGADPLPNVVGLAPGFRVTRGRAELYFLPGVPREMESIFDAHVTPRLRHDEEARGAVLPAVRTWHVYGMGESHIDHHLAGLVDGIPGATLHFRTAAPENHVKIVLRAERVGEGNGDGANGALAGRLATLDAEVRRRLGAVVYGVDGDTFPAAVARVLRAAGVTLGFAESCTGGYAGQLFTMEPGASDVFRGAIVAYENQVKVELLGVAPQTLDAHGAVSEPCAVEMAEGARRHLGVDLAVSITGIAGSDATGRLGPAATGEGGKPVAAGEGGGKPVGTVCFGFAGPRGTQAQTKQFHGGRERIRRAAAYHALDLARRHFDG